MNARLKRGVKGTVKDFERAIAVAGNAGVKELSSVQQAIDKALKSGVLKKNTAARMKSRLSKLSSKK